MSKGLIASGPPQKPVLGLLSEAVQLLNYLAMEEAVFEGADEGDDGAVLGAAANSTILR